MQFFFWAVTVTSFDFWGINYYSMQFEQVKCTLSGSCTVTVFKFLGLAFSHASRIVTRPKFLGIVNVSKLLGPDIFRWRGVFHVKGWGPKVWYVTRNPGTPNFRAGYPGILAGKSRKKFERNKNVRSIFAPYLGHFWPKVPGQGTRRANGRPDRNVLALASGLHFALTGWGNPPARQIPPKLGKGLRFRRGGTEPKNPWIPEIQKNCEKNTKSPMHPRLPPENTEKSQKIQKWPKTVIFSYFRGAFWGGGFCFFFVSFSYFRDSGVFGLCTTPAES